jgi:hypothetical protein
MRGARPSALGQELRYRPRPPTARCSTDSGHIAAPPRTGVWGHNLPRTLLRAYWRSAYALPLCEEFARSKLNGRDNGPRSMPVRQSEI